MNTDTGANAEAPPDKPSIDLDLIERRKLMRPLPTPHAIERNDDEVWELWNHAVASF